MKHLHTIPVPPFWNPESAWEVICKEGRLPEYEGKPTWAVIECDGEECKGVERTHLRAVEEA